MSEDEIRDHLNKIAISVESDDSKTAVSSGIALIGQLLIDIHQIAEALKK